MLVILAVSYFAHIVISLSYFFQNTNVWIIVVFIHEKTEAPLNTAKHFPIGLLRTQRHEGYAYTKMFGFYVLCHSGLFLPLGSDPKKVEG
jgi:hypothetical protein